VLSHFVPAEDAAISDEMWARAAKTHFDGEVVLGRDLLEL
jgi:ribonuclease BN (tRNA processing enzyme)